VLPPELPQHVQNVLDFFQKVSTQWRAGGMGGLIGLDYNAVVEMAKIYEFELNTLNMDILREIERFYIERQNNGSR